MDFEIDQNQLASIMRRLDNVSPEDKYRVLRRAMDSVMNVVRNQLVQNTSGKILNVRTGRLRSSMQSRVFSSGSIGTMIGVAGSGVLQGNRVKYANIHETGGVIRPKKGKYLTIPIRSGKASHSSKIEGFRRVKQVTIPARKYMSKSLEEVSDRLIDVLKAGINKGLEG